MAFKMKGNPMKRNFGKYIPKYSTNIPGINNESEGNTDLPDGRSASSPLQKVTDPTIRELQRTLKKGKYVKGPRKDEEVSDRDRISLEEQLRDLQQAKDDPGSKYHPAYDKEGPGKRSKARRDVRKSPTKHSIDPHTTKTKRHTSKNPDTNKVETSKPHTHNPETGQGILKKSPAKDASTEKHPHIHNQKAIASLKATKTKGELKKSPTKHNLPGIRHTKPKKHGEYKQPHVHGVVNKGKGSDPTNEERATKVKRKYYRKAKKKAKNK
jgi:hypothetical protein